MKTRSRVGVKKPKKTEAKFQLMEKDIQRMEEKVKTFTAKAGTDVKEFVLGLMTGVCLFLFIFLLTYI